VENTIKPVTPKSSQETKALLKFLYSISGKYTLTGQHNFPNIKDRNSRFAAQYIGKTPAVFSTDWGFAKDGDTDSYLARPDIVAEAIRQHRLGSIITICWHAVPPTADEPVTFRPPPGRSTPPESLASVQGQLPDQQFKDVLTPGTELYKRWCAQVDSIAGYLKKLQDAHVPILWRPYHEMNGNWFWWGGRHGEYSTKALYIQLFNRFVKHHKLNNLVWVWSVDRPNRPEMQFSNYFPGHNYLDILSLDVYGSDFNQTYYDSLVAISKGKPVILGEVGSPPTLEIFQKQPKWALYVIWAGMVRNTLRKQHQILVNDPRILSFEDPAYIQAIAPFRAACGLPPLILKEKKSEPTRVNFSGEWLFNEEKSVLDNWGVSAIPDNLIITQPENELNIQKKFILEYAEDRITDEKLSLDGKESRSEMWNSPRIMTAKWSEKGDSLSIDSKVQFGRGGQSFEMTVNEVWSLQEQGKILVIKQSSTSFRGTRKISMFYDRQ
jgi:mannan endo-1,4-beta-mannosidase